MRWSWQAPLVFVIGLVACALYVTAIAAETPVEVEDEDLWGPLPAELREVLQAKSRAYAERARGFTCVEAIRRATYKDNEAVSEVRRSADYLLIEDSTNPGGFRGLRTREGSSGRSEINPDLPFPDPFLWTQLFEPALLTTMKFQIGEWRTTPYKLAIPISWVASGPVFDGDRLNEWSGTMEIEYRTGNILSVSAQPNLQARRIKGELQRYLTATRFLGFSTAPPPDGKDVNVTFGYEHQGFTYPSRVELRTFRQLSRDTSSTTKREVVEYDKYRFFGTRSEAEVPPLIYDPRAAEGAPRNN